MSAPRHTRQAVGALTAAARAERDWAEWLVGVIAATAANVGSTDELLRGRDGSWEASLVRQILAAAVGPDDEWLQPPTEPRSEAER